MAAVNKGLLAGVAASMRDRVIRAESAAPAGGSLGLRAEGRRRLESACVLRVDRIAADPGQPRKEFDPDDLARLAESLKSRGQLQPVRVRWDEAAGLYVVVAGERRWRAAVAAGLETLACVVAEGDATPEDRLEDQLVENCLRADLKPVEQARAFRTLLEGRGYTQRQLAARLQIGQATISKALALLELPEAARAAVDAGEMGADEAYRLSRAKPGRPKAREPVTVDVEGYSVRVTFRRGSEGGDAATGLRRALRALQARKG